MSETSVFIGMPVYNGEKYLRTTLDSILAQTAGDFELLIADNASTDATADICAEYARLDSRIQYHRHAQNIGAPRNWNYVAERATRSLFKWASANDTYDPRFLERCIETLAVRPDAVLCYSDTLLIDDRGEVIDAYDDPLDVTSSNPAARFTHLLSTSWLNNPQAGVIRTDVLKRTRLEGIYPGSDVALMAELCLYGTFVRIPEPLFFRRMSADAATAFADKHEIQRFVAPEAAESEHCILWPKYLDLMRSVLRAPINASARLKAAAHIARMMNWKRAELWDEARHVLRGKMRFVA